MNSHTIKISNSAEENYNTVHNWINREYGKANKCENPECRGLSKNYHWAKLRGKVYFRDRNNFWMLCVSCHHEYDGTSRGGWNKGLKGVQVAWNKGIPWSDDVKKKLSLAKIGKAPPNKGKGSGKWTKEFRKEYMKHYYQQRKNEQ